MGSRALPKMMLGFVVRRCAAALGHAPTPAEFAAWANAQRNGDEASRLFGRPITEKEAALILRHPARPVSARSAAPHEQLADRPVAAPNVIPLNFSSRRRTVRVAPAHARGRRR